MKFDKLVKKLVSAKYSSITLDRITDDNSSLQNGPINFRGKDLYCYNNFGGSFIQSQMDSSGLFRGFYIHKGFMSDFSEITINDGCEKHKYTILTIFELASLKNDLRLAVIDYELDPKGYLSKNTRTLGAAIFSYAELEKRGVKILSFKLNE